MQTFCGRNLSKLLHRVAAGTQQNMMGSNKIIYLWVLYIEASMK